ncbi:MAG: hypothetical protein BYD32DRAFT_276098 [Podila humilis]|nr:MAG: hypothetical protein BYD32DRAFT_276098 [Podila humilis]
MHSLCLTYGRGFLVRARGPRPCGSMLVESRIPSIVPRSRCAQCLQFRIENVFFFVRLNYWYSFRLVFNSLRQFLEESRFLRVHACPAYRFINKTLAYIHLASLFLQVLKLLHHPINHLLDLVRDVMRTQKAALSSMDVYQRSRMTLGS